MTFVFSLQYNYGIIGAFQIIAYIFIITYSYDFLSMNQERMINTYPSPFHYPRLLRRGSLAGLQTHPAVTVEGVAGAFSFPSHSSQRRVSTPDFARDAHYIGFAGDPHKFPKVQYPDLGAA